MLELHVILASFFGGYQIERDLIDVHFFVMGHHIFCCRNQRNDPYTTKYAVEQCLI